MILTNILSLFAVIFSLTTNVNSQTCENKSQYDLCSSNSACGCLSLSFADNFRICGMLNLRCDQFVPCQSPNDVCGQSGHICVRHPRCDSRPICFPMAMTDQNLCPPTAVMTSTRPSIIVSNYSSELTTMDGIYTRPGTSTSNGQYYEAIQLVVDTTGTYDLTSLSNMDTHGFLYNGTFYPLNPSSNLAQHNDDGSANSQFKLTAFLQASVPYTLVVTTHLSRVTGPFSVTAAGPGDVQFIPINTISTTTTTSTTTRPSIIFSNYSNALTINNEQYPNSNKYYQAIEIRVNTTGAYTLTCSSNMDTFGYLYQGNFYPSYSELNKIIQDDDSAGNRDFKLTASLRADITYILVVTTYSEGVTGPYSIVASGPDDVSFNPISINTQ